MIPIAGGLSTIASNAVPLAWVRRSGAPASPRLRLPFVIRERARRLGELLGAGNSVSPRIEGKVQMALGWTRAALDRLEAAVDEKAPWTPGIGAWPYVDPLRGEAAVRRAGPPDRPDAGGDSETLGDR